MIFLLKEEHKKYLVPVLGHWFKCVIATTPPEIVKQLKEINAWLEKEMHHEPIITFV